MTVFLTEEVVNGFWKKVDRCRNDLVLQGVSILPHYPRKQRMVVVRMYSPYILEGEIVQVLSHYCDKITPMGKVFHEYGLWTMKRRFMVDFKEDSEGEPIFPPSRFKIGSVNGDVFFGGMPDFCRNCRSYGHVAEGCAVVWCWSTEHRYASCPDREKNKDQTQRKEEKEPEKESEKKREEKPEEKGKEEEVVVVKRKVAEKKQEPEEMEISTEKEPEVKIKVQEEEKIPEITPEEPSSMKSDSDEKMLETSSIDK